MTTVICENLYKATYKARKASNPVKSLPVTSHLKIMTHDGHVVVTPFDFDVQYRRENAQAIPARIDTDFETCVPSRPFVDWLRVTQDTKNKEGNHDHIHFKFDPYVQILTVTAGNTRAQFKCIDAQEFPPS